MVYPKALIATLIAFVNTVNKIATVRIQLIIYIVYKSTVRLKNSINSILIGSKYRNEQKQSRLEPCSDFEFYPYKK